jgi:hypothetical protein
MHVMSVRRYITTSLIIVFLTVGTLVWLDRYGKSCRVIDPTGSIQEQAIIKKMVDDPKEAYRIWRNSGYQGRTILYVADRWESFDPDTLIPAQMFRAYPLRLYNTAKLLEEEHLSGVTLLYVASMNKIIRRIVAIMPVDEVARLAVTVRNSKDYRVSDKQVFVSRQAFPRWYSSGANFGGVAEPVLLYVGASYFKHAEPEVLYRQLVKAGLQTDCVVLCNETGKATVSANEIAKLNVFARLIGMAPSGQLQSMVPAL